MQSGEGRKGIGFRSTVAGFGLLGTLALLLWVKTRFDREPTADASAAYSRHFSPNATVRSAQG